MYTNVNPSTIINSKHTGFLRKLSELHILSYARAFKSWCIRRDEFNPRQATFVTWLEINVPEKTYWDECVHYSWMEIWDKFSEIWRQ